MAILTWLFLPCTKDNWHSLGFSAARVGQVAVGAGAEEPQWGFDALEADPGPLGVPTRKVPAPTGEAPQHPNLVERIDHVVYAVPRLDDAVTAIGSVLGLSPRRRDTNIAFFRAGEAVIEAVEGAEKPRLWGVAFLSPNLDWTVAAVRRAGGEIGEVKPALQGGRIATVPGLRIAFMAP